MQNSSATTFNRSGGSPGWILWILVIALLVFGATFLVTLAMANQATQFTNQVVAQDGLHRITMSWNLTAQGCEGKITSEFNANNSWWKIEAQSGPFQFSPCTPDKLEGIIDALAEALHRSKKFLWDNAIEALKSLVALSAVGQ